jgi:thiol:disulfide interchange protein DsbA
MISKTSFLKILFVALIAGFLFPAAPFAGEPEAPFPTFGSGAVEVRLYTDYFCPPCRALEPEVEPVLKKLLRKKTIRLTLVDVPHNPNSPLYARYFLYSLAKRQDVEHAIHVRNILFEAAARKDSNAKEQMESLLKSRGIAYESRDTKSVFNRYNALIKEDRIEATPTCVIIKGDKREKSIGRPDIVSALKKLQ